MDTREMKVKLKEYIDQYGEDKWSRDMEQAIVLLEEIEKRELLQKSSKHVV